LLEKKHFSGFFIALAIQYKSAHAAFTSKEFICQILLN